MNCPICKKEYEPCSLCSGQHNHQQCIDDRTMCHECLMVLRHSMSPEMLKDAKLMRDDGRLKELTLKLVNFMYKMGEEPYYITSPSISIMKEYGDVIKPLEGDK